MKGNQHRGSLGYRDSAAEDRSSLKYDIPKMRGQRELKTGNLRQTAIKVEWQLWHGVYGHRDLAL